VTEARIEMMDRYLQNEVNENSSDHQGIDKLNTEVQSKDEGEGSTLK